MDLKERILDVIRGSHVAAVATVGERGAPAVRHMLLTGYDDLMLAGGTRAGSKKVAQIRRTPYVGIAIWSEKDLMDPYVQIHGVAGVHDDRETKLKYWDPAWDRFFGPVDNPEVVVLVFQPDAIEYYDPKAVIAPEVWRRS